MARWKRLICAALLAAPLAAFAQSPTTTGLVVEEGKGEEGRSRWGLQLIAETTVGFGTFVRGHADDPLVTEFLSVRPSFRIDEIPGGASLLLRQDLQVELTRPNAPTGRRFDWADTMLWLVAPQLLVEEKTEIVVGGEARLTVPISLESRWADKITAATLGLRLARPFGEWVPQLRVLGTRHFYLRAAPVHEEDDLGGDGDLPIARCARGREEACVGGPYHLAWSLAAWGGLSWRFEERWSATLSMQWVAGWRFAAPEDEFTSPHAQRGAQRAADVASTTLDLTWQRSERLAFSFGVSTTQPVRTADNRSLRFPLLDVATPANNYSGFYLDVIAGF